MLSRDSEDKMWSRFVIWPQEVTLARWTQPSGPLCLWQCLIIAIDIAVLHQTTRKTSNVGIGRGVKGYWLLVSSTSSAEAAGCKEVKPARRAELTKNPILKQSNCFCHTAVRSNKRESYLRQQHCGMIGLSYSNWGFEYTLWMSQSIDPIQY